MKRFTEGNKEVHGGRICCLCHLLRVLPRWLSSKESTHQRRRCRKASSVLGLGRSPRGGNGNPLWYFFLENPMDRGA